MQLFFIVSGYLFSSAKYPRFKLYLVKRSKSILIPYITFATITIIMCFLVNYISGQNLYNMREAALGIVWSNRSLFPITGGCGFYSVFSL